MEETKVIEQEEIKSVQEPQEVKAAPKVVEEPEAEQKPAKKEEVYSGSESLMNFLSVVFLLASIGYGIYVAADGLNHVNELKKMEIEASATPYIIRGFVIFFMGLLQFGFIRLFVNMSHRLTSIDAQLRARE